MLSGHGLAASGIEVLGKRLLDEEPIKTAEVAVVESEVGEPDVVEPAATAPPSDQEAAVAEAIVVDTVSPQPEAQRVPDDLGIEKKKKEQAAKKKSYRGHVRSCGQMSDNRWYFVFDRGQMWKQSSDGIHRFKECDFDVTITKDFFGYKMKIDGGITLRVKRER